MLVGGANQSSDLGAGGQDGQQGAASLQGPPQQPSPGAAVLLAPEGHL